MALLTPLQRLIKNLRQELPAESRAYMSREEAYAALKARTGEDFGYDDKKWEEWLDSATEELKWQPSGKRGDGELGSGEGSGNIPLQERHL